MHDGLPKSFHPAVIDWFRARFRAPTDVQARAWQVTSRRQHALIAAPTGSGKTLAAFLAAINELVVEGLERGLEDEVHVLYVSPLKALSNDIQKNLQAPLCGVRDRLLELGLPDVVIRDAVRTGDTSPFERERMRRLPPHILVTTPESLFILLTSDSGRKMLGRVRTVIVDELHAVAGTKRGAHLALSLERLEALCARPPVRIGLSATVKPLDEMARFLVGQREPYPSPRSPPTREGGVAIVDAGHVRERALALELPRSPLDAVMATEVWSELYDRLAELVGRHRTTLIFVNQRRLAERAARHLGERIGEEHVAAHHGSLAKEHRFRAEQRLKQGQLKALVATSSLELGIDIGEIDLVCQLGSPRSIAAFLQRVGRAGHAIGAVPKGRLFPLTLDDLLECTALLDSARRGELDRIHVPEHPLDVLAQQIVAEVASREWDATGLYDALRRAWPYRELPRKDYDAVVQMLADGYSTRRGRRGAYLHFDAVNGRLRARRGARLVAVTNAGTIPDQFDYEVVLMPEEHRIGTVNEDFAFESIPGDVFQLGNVSYRILKIETGRVLVEDARGQPPGIPFWFAEVPGRTDELSESVSRLSRRIEALLDAAPSRLPAPASGDGENACERWLQEEVGVAPAAAAQLVRYLAAAKAALTVLPTRDTVVFERFFDEVGDTHLVIHSPFGSRVNRAWGLALRKRFCRQFNFELQASALEDSIVLSLGPTHSFPLEDVRHFLKSASARDVLVQALLAAPMFGTHWRWNASIALAVRRMNGGKRVPPQFQRSDSEDLLAVTFPDQLACAENIVGDREVPDHPLVQQTLHDCLHQVMDVDGFLDLIRRMERGELRVICRDLTAPSPLAQAILNARPFAFLDDGAAEERRTKAVATQRLMDADAAGGLGRIDPAAVAQVLAEVRPEPANVDELHDALVVHGFLTEAELAPWRGLAQTLLAERRAAPLARPGAPALWVTAERLHEFLAVFPGVTAPIAPVRAARPDASAALAEILRSRLELLGPVTVADLGASLGLDAATIAGALLMLEAEGSVMRGRLRGGTDEEWCERRLLARIHRYTRERSRAGVRPVAPADFLRFLLRWHGMAPGSERREGEAALVQTLRQLEGYSIPAAAWEEDILPQRVRNYLPGMLDRLCSAGRVAWWRPAPESSGGEARRAAPVRNTPIVLGERGHDSYWRRDPVPEPLRAAGGGLSARAARVLDSLRRHGASFFDDLLHDTGLLRTELEQCLGELVGLGLVSSDSFAGLRALILPAQRRERLRRYGRPQDVAEAGRWSLPRPPRAADAGAALAEPAVEHVARVLLRRYGVVFRHLLEREDHLPPWRDLFYVYRRLEARGEVHGGRFVSGFSGEQFALPEAAALLRKLPPAEPEELVAISAADPLNLVGILTPGEKVPALAGNRVLFRNGVPVAVQAGDQLRLLQKIESKSEWEIRNLLIRRQKPGGVLDAPGAVQ